MIHRFSKTPAYYRYIILLLFVLSTPFVSLSQDLNNGLIFHYEFENNLFDKSPNQIEPYGNVGFGVDRFGNSNSCLQLDGAAQFLTTDHNPILKPELPISYSLWINYGLQGEWNHIFVSNRFENGYHGSWISINPDGNLNGAFGDGSGCICPEARQSFKTESKLNPKEWHFVVITMDSNYDFQVYINCEEEEVSTSGSGGNSIAYDSRPSDIGTTLSPNGELYYNGRIDDFRYWNRKLSKAEIDLLIDENLSSSNSGLVSFNSYEVEDQVGSSQIDHTNRTIDIEVPCDADLAGIVSTFTLTNEAIVTVESVEQISAVSNNDFTSEVVYTLTNEQYCVGQDWTVRVTHQEISNTQVIALTSFLTTEIQHQIGGAEVDFNAHSISFEVSCMTDLANLILTFSTANDVSIVANNQVQLSGVTTNDFSLPVIYTIESEEYCVSQDWTILVKKQETLSLESNITLFNSIEIQNQIGESEIDKDNNSITFEVGCQSELSELYLNLEVGNNSEIMVNNETYESGDDLDFQGPLSISLVNYDNCTFQNWTVSVKHQQFSIVDLENSSLLVPNAFTPNGDGVNDTFNLGEEFEGSFLSIFNRYGKRVYKSKNYKNDFDGGLLPAGTYYYLIESDCLVEHLNGPVTILY